MKVFNAGKIWRNLAWCGDMISNFSGHCLNALGIIKKEQLVTYICF